MQHDTERSPRRGSRVALWVPIGTAVVAAALLLGPLLGPGVTVVYDMPWSPIPRLTPFSLGIGTPAPRAVPGDAVVTVLGLLLGAALAQKLILATLLVVAGLGAGRLLTTLRPRAGVLARAATVLAAIWNPFVLDRLAVGQWVVLLGYAVTPFALARTAASAGGRGGALGWCLILGVASLGGANPWLMVTTVVLLALCVTRPRALTWALVLATTLGSAAVWAVPALLHQIAAAPTGAGAFAPRADTPFGAWISLLSGGGFWNAAAHLGSRGQLLLVLPAVLIALASAAAALRALIRQAPRILVTVLVPLGVVLVSATPALRSWWEMIVGVPGGGLLRDSQKLIAPWVVVVTVGLGILVSALQSRSRRIAVLAPTAVALTLTPVVLQPGGVWGMGGRLAATEVPDEFTTVATLVSEQPDGTVGVLPWSQYRRYDWNERRISLTLLPRMVDQVTLYDDSLPLLDRQVPGEDPRAQRVSTAIAAGRDPVTALREEGAAYVIVEKRAGLPVQETDEAADVLHDGPHLRVLRVGDVRETPMDGALRLGWMTTLMTWFALVAAAARPTGTVFRRWAHALLRSRA